MGESSLATSRAGRFLERRTFCWGPQDQPCFCLETGGWEREAFAQAGWQQRQGRDSVNQVNVALAGALDHSKRMHTRHGPPPPPPLPSPACLHARPPGSHLGKSPLQGNFPLVNFSFEAETGLTGRGINTKCVQTPRVCWDLGSWYAWGLGNLALTCDVSSCKHSVQLRKWEILGWLTRKVRCHIEHRPVFRMF